MIASVEIKKALPPTGWDDVVSRLGGSIYQSAIWANYVRATSSEMPYFILGHNEAGCECSAAVGFLRMSKWPLTRRLFREMSLPSHPAILGGDGDVTRDFIRQCEQTALSAGCYSMALDSFMSGASPFVPADQGYEQTMRIEFSVDLRRDADSLWRGMHQDHRERVRKLGRKGMTVETGTSRDDLLLLKNCREATQEKRSGQGLGYELPTEDEYYDRLHRLLMCNGGARLLIAKYNGDAVGALFFTVFNRRACSMLSGSTEAGYKLGAQSSLFWAAVEMFKAEGFSELNRGGILASAADPKDPLHGIYNFKSRLGTTPLFCRSGVKVLRPLRARLRTCLRSVLARN